MAEKGGFGPNFLPKKLNFGGQKDFESKMFFVSFLITLKKCHENEQKK